MTNTQTTFRSTVAATLLAVVCSSAFVLTAVGPAGAANPQGAVQAQRA